MILYPRVCYVCHSADQDSLKKCPRCPNASFCPEHPSSPTHNEDCPEIQKCHQYDVEYERMSSPSNLESLIKGIIELTPFRSSKSNTLPTTLEEYFKYLKNDTDNGHYKTITVLNILAELMSMALAAFGALMNLNFVSSSKLVIHMLSTPSLSNHLLGWEILLHLFPTINILKVVFLKNEKYLKYQIGMCNKCTGAKKKLIIEFISHSYLDFTMSKDFEEPGLILMPNLNSAREEELYKRILKHVLLTVGMLNCPLVFLFDSEEKAEMAKDCIKSSFNKFLITYDSRNNFTPLRLVRNWETDRMCRLNERMMIVKVFHTDEPGNCNRCGVTCRTVDLRTSNCVTCESELLSQDAVLFPKQIKQRLLNIFYVNCCQVCYSTLDTLSENNYVSCQKCKMVFYCDNNHRKEHWPYHKDLCKVICGMIKSSSSSNLFDKADKSISQTWLQSKINLLLEAQAKLGRNLLTYEKEMFLFPKTCFICYKSDTSLRTCKCALSFCDGDHWNSEEHKKLCVELYFTQQCSIQLMEIIGSSIRIPSTDMLLVTTRKEIFEAIPVKNEVEECEDLPKSMNTFIKTCIMFIFNEFWELNTPKSIFNLREILFAELFTRPLTLFDAFQIYKWSLDSMVVHVIGATDVEKSVAGYWEILLHFIPLLKNLMIIFVGPEVSELQLTEVHICKVCLKKGKRLEARGVTLKYDEYVNDDCFVEPNIVIGFNLHIHESNLGMTEDTWKDSILTLKKINAPFIMTAKTYLKAQMDLEKLESYFGNGVKCDCLKLNEFRSDLAYRDFETEKYETCNQFVSVFCGLFERLSSATDDNSKNELEPITENQDLELVQKMENLSAKS